MRSASVRGAAFVGFVALALGVAALWRERPSPPSPPQAPAVEAPTAVPAPPSPAPSTVGPGQAATAPTVSSAAAPVLLDEPALMARLRWLKERDAALRVDLAREGNRRFPDTADAPERASILIHALASLGRSSEARGAAEEMVNHYPDSDWVQEIEHFTGAHRHRRYRVGADGGLESY
ncbi:MAG: hypothetical protein WBY94_11690 [Polyangiaceae bacterium]